MYLQILLGGLIGGLFQLKKITRWIRKRKE